MIIVSTEYILFGIFLGFTVGLFIEAQLSGSALLNQAGFLRFFKNYYRRIFRNKNFIFISYYFDNYNLTHNYIFECNKTKEKIKMHFYDHRRYPREASINSIYVFDDLGKTLNINFWPSCVFKQVKDINENIYKENIIKEIL